MAFEPFTPSGRNYDGVSVGVGALNISHICRMRLLKAGWKRVRIYGDKEKKVIKFERAEHDGFKFGGVAIGVSLHRTMPRGRYLVEKETDDEIIFKMHD